MKFFRFFYLTSLLIFTFETLAAEKAPVPGARETRRPRVIVPETVLPASLSHSQVSPPKLGQDRNLGVYPVLHPLAVRPIARKSSPAEVRKAICSVPGLSEEWWERMLNPPETSQVSTALPAVAAPEIARKSSPSEARKAVRSALDLSVKWWERMLNPPETSQVSTALPAVSAPAPEAEERVTVTGSMLFSISHGYAPSVSASGLSASTAPKPALPTRIIYWKVGGKRHQRVITSPKEAQKSSKRTIKRSKRLREEPLPTDAKEAQESPSPKRRPRPDLPL